MNRVPALVGWVAGLLLAAAGCGGVPCQPIGMGNPLLAQATRFHVEVHPAGAACDAGGGVAGGGSPSQSFDELRFDLAPGRYTLVLLAYSGDLLIGRSCQSIEVVAGRPVCIDLPLLPVDDAAALSDLAPADAAPVDARLDAANTDLPACFGQGCPCGDDTACRDKLYPRCSPTKRQCVPCVSRDDNCPARTYCAGEQSCEPGCKDDRDCPRERPRCEPAPHQCKECVRVEDCAPGRQCSPAGACVDGCAQGQACAQGLACCDQLCIDPRSDALNCGACGKRCDNGAACCAGGCVTVQADVAHCGGCDIACVGVNGTASCSKGACQWLCKSGFAHCGVGNTGCETALSTLDNCGGCGNACNKAHGPTCDGTTCRYTCPSGLGDCQAVAPDLDGCETSLRLPASCGGCGVDCGLPNAKAASCPNGVCVYECSPGFGDCESKPPNTNGCERQLNTVDSCGGCALSCPPVGNGAPLCEQGKCAAACNGAFADCDGNLQNGCETSTATAIAHCGGCNKPCGAVANGKAQCVGGACVASCNGGFADCDKQFANGCEANLDTSPASCGGCGNPCTIANGVAGCVAGQCTVASCNSTFRDCDGSPANGCELDTASDVKNCSACNLVCPLVMNGSPACVAGKCGAAPCGGVFKDCDMNGGNGCEVDSSSDARNCGACAKVCPAVMNGTPGCAMSKCGIAGCGGGFGDCDGQPANGCETATSSSALHCGGCGKPCAAVVNGVAGCVAGKCVIASCNASFRDCDGQIANGCETDTAAHVGHCGGCNMACGAAANGTAGCVAAKCVVASCKAPYKDCDGGFGNGCEVDTSSSLVHCGDCNKPCNNAPGATAACVAGVCKLTCNGNLKDCDQSPANGCECGVVCCPNKTCQPQHLNGLGQSYADCAPLGTPGSPATYTPGMANAARAAWVVAQPFDGTAQCGVASCIARQSASMCAVWCSSNDGPARLAGHVRVNATCTCPSEASPTWN